ncbi:MAG: type IA DNA topoisomerase [Clostridium sp.]|nr:type IA DNA topoisomerase [Clostridium sp.]
MGKSLFIAEKPSVAQQFAQVLKVSGRQGAGYLENADYVVTWCVGHLVTMSYPEAYDEKYKKWSLETLPFLPKEYRYEVIKDVQKQFDIVKGLLTRPDVDTIYVCTDSGREGEYIYRLVAQMAGVSDKTQKRVWIDSQTEEEILRGIREAKDEADYDNLAASAYLRAKEDYLMGINFSRALTLKYGPAITNYRRSKWTVISVGRVMTCVLGMVVRREREIREFVKTPFYRVIGTFAAGSTGEEKTFDAEWKAVEGSRYFGTPALYKDNGFRKREDAEALIAYLTGEPRGEAKVASLERKKEVKNPPLLYNLAELQNDCSKYFHLSPDQTLQVAQELYEKKLVTYPRTDARVLSTAVAKEITKNIGGLQKYEPMAPYAGEAMAKGLWKTIAKTRYVNDKLITDHYAIIPTGFGLGALNSLTPQKRAIYEMICRRFLSIFYPPAIYRKYSVDVEIKGEHFLASFRVLEEPGYLAAAYRTKGGEDSAKSQDSADPELLAALEKLRKGSIITLKKLFIREGETTPPKRYTSGSMILAMENAGQLIEDEELRAQIKGSGIGTSATRADILKKLVNIRYLMLNKKTQVITPSFLGEMVYEVVFASMKQMLNPDLTASWEKGLTYVSEGSITSEEYMEKLENFVSARTMAAVRGGTARGDLIRAFDAAARYYKPGEVRESSGSKNGRASG